MRPPEVLQLDFRVLKKFFLHLVPLDVNMKKNRLPKFI